MVDTVPPKRVQTNAERGLRLREQWGRGGLSPREAGDEGIRSGVNSARKIASGESLSRDLISSMASFARFLRNYNPNDKESDGGPTANTIAVLLWGGPEGIEWAQRTLAKLKEEDMGKNFTKKADRFMIGDYVSWNSNGSTAYGRIVRQVTEGALQIPGTDFVLRGTEENPAYLIRLYVREVEEEEGEIEIEFEETDIYIGHLADALTRIPAFDMLDQAEDESEEEEEEDEGEETEEIIEMANADDAYLYLSDRMAFEKEQIDADSEIKEGDFVMWEAGGNLYKGRVLKITPDEIVQSSAGLKLEGREDDPAVLVRLFREDENGELIESDLKAVHRISTLQKMPKPTNDFVNTPSKSMKGSKESKTFAFNITETKEVEIDGLKYGIVRGYASTYGNVDRGNDRVITGAFNKSLKRYQETRRPIKMYFNHDSNEIIGGFPVDKIRDDANGLYVEGQINLEVQKGREAYALAKQGVMQDFSIGYTVEDYDLKAGVRELKELELWEISMVGEPMNPEARILSVKNVTPYKDLPLAAEDYSWDVNAAIKRIREFTDSKDAPSASYKNAFMYFDTENPNEFSSYKLPYADVIDGDLKAVPRAIFAIAGALKGARGGVEVAESDKQKIINNLNKYYAKMDKDSPFEDKQYCYQDVIKIKSKRDLEKLLRESGVFSKKAAVYLSSLLHARQSDSALKDNELRELKKLINYIKGKSNELLK